MFECSRFLMVQRREEKLLLAAEPSSRLDGKGVWAGTWHRGSAAQSLQHQVWPFWLLFCSVGGSVDMLSIAFTVYGLDKWIYDTVCPPESADGFIWWSRYSEEHQTSDVVIWLRYEMNIGRYVLLSGQIVWSIINQSEVVKYFCIP